MAARAYDAMVINRVAVDRFATGLIQRLLPILGVAEGEIEAKLAAYLAKHGTGYDSGTRRQLTRLLAQVRDISRVAHGSLYARLRGEMFDLAKAEVEGAKDLAGRLYGLGTAFNTPTSRVLRQLVEDRPFQGRVLSEWVDGLEQTSFIRFRDAVTQGIVQGEGETEILRRFTGTKALQYKDGVASVGKRMLGAAVRTATAHVHNVSHEAFAKENPELYKGVRWITVLDARACEVCQGYAGEIFPVDEGPRPPIHWNCRCTIENIPVGSPIEAEPTYENWLSEQPEETQVEILGGTAFKLWKDGNLRLREFVSDSDPAKALTLAQLKSVRKAAWDRAFGGDITPVRDRDITLPTKSFREMDRAFRAANPTVRSQLAGTDLRFVQQQRNGGALTSEVVEPEVFDQLPGKVVYRGVIEADMVPAQFGPADFVGDGVSGQGVYTTPTVAEATSYGHPDQGGWTYAMKIDPRAKVIERGDVEKVLKQHFTEDQLADTALEKNSLLALKGYDVVHNNELGDDHWIILNKKAVVIDKASLPENAAKLLGEDATVAGQKLLEEIAAIEVEKRGLLDEMQAVRQQFKGFAFTQENMEALDKLYRPIHEKYARIDERQSELRGRVERMGYGKRYRLEAAYKARYEK